MKNFAYTRAGSPSEALEQLAVPGRTTDLLGAGIDLLDLLKEGLATPDVLVSLAELEELRAIDVPASGMISIGARATVAEVAAHAGLGAVCAALVQAASETATPQVRTRATVGGNLLQRPRCWYFRRLELQCLRKGGAFCLAVGGENRDHAILGGGPCWYIHPSSLAVPLVALDASLRILGASGVRDVPVGEFFVPPAEDATREHRLEPGELLEAILIPVPSGADVSAHCRLTEKQSHDWPMAEAAVRVRVEGGVVSECRLVLGAVAPIPWRAREAETYLVGKPATGDSFRAAAELALVGAYPLSDNAYKVDVAKVALESALREAFGLAWDA